MKKHIHAIIRAASGAIVILTLSGCAQISAAAAKVNWYKVGAYACLRLSDTLNDKADQREQELAAKCPECRNCSECTCPKGRECTSGCE